jgi:hypothetical protein
MWWNKMDMKKYFRNKIRGEREEARLKRRKLRGNADKILQQ